MVTVLGENGYLGAVVKRRWLELGDSDHVINCIRPDDLLLSERLAEDGRLIQPSTDAIAEGSSYARTKRILERIPGAVIIRAGIVDIRHDLTTAYLNWRCNPLTPLEWADFAWSVRDRPGLHITGREGVSRYELAALVAELWERPAPARGWAEVPLSRVQSATDPLDRVGMPAKDWKPGRRWPPLREALIEFREWLRS